MTDVRAPRREPKAGGRMLCARWYSARTLQCGWLGGSRSHWQVLALLLPEHTFHFNPKIILIIVYYSFRGKNCFDLMWLVLEKLKEKPYKLEN